MKITFSEKSDDLQNEKEVDVNRLRIIVGDSEFRISVSDNGIVVNKNGIPTSAISVLPKVSNEIEVR